MNPRMTFSYTPIGKTTSFVGAFQNIYKLLLKNEE